MATNAVTKLNINNTEYSISDAEATKNYNWGGTVKINEWSRVCYIGNYSVVGGVGIFIIRGTRNSVVYNKTILLQTNHAGGTYGSAVLLSSDNYCNLHVRFIVSSSGNVIYAEVLDNNANYDSATYQNVSCTYIPISGCTDFTPYTSYNAGSEQSGYFTVYVYCPSDHAFKTTNNIMAPAFIEDGSYLSNKYNQKATISGTTLVL